MQIYNNFSEKKSLKQYFNILILRLEAHARRHTRDVIDLLRFATLHLRVFNLLIINILTYKASSKTGGLINRYAIGLRPPETMAKMAMVKIANYT